MGNVSLYKYRSGGGVMERLIKDGDGMCTVQGEGGSGVEDDESSTLSQKVATQERKPYLNTSD